MFRQFDGEFEIQIKAKLDCVEFNGQRSNPAEV
jgi:hypothetical protein